MKIHVLADIHLEFADFTPPETEAEAVILAGDIGLGTIGIEWAKTAFPEKQIFYVLGNHEFYGHDFDMLLDKAREAVAGSNVALLENDSLEFGGIRFLGATLWTDFQIFGEKHLAQTMRLVRQGFNDYRLISKNELGLFPADTLERHQKSINFLNTTLSTPFDGPTVVVTHHAPSLMSVPKKWKSHPLAGGFVSNLESLIAKASPTAWIHGHIHESADYTFRKTRILCNPRGYPHEDISAFKKDYILELQTTVVVE